MTAAITAVVRDGETSQRARVMVAVSSELAAVPKAVPAVHDGDRAYGDEGAHTAKAPT